MRGMGVRRTVINVAVNGLGTRLKAWVPVA